MLRRLIRSWLVRYIKATPPPSPYASLADDDWSTLSDPEMLRRVVSG